MIKEIKEKLKKAWEWTKEKVKKFKKWIIALLIPIVLAAPLLIPPNRSFENLPNVIKEEALYRIKYDKWSEVEIPEIAMPEAVLRKWGDETWIKISYPDFNPVNPKQHQEKLKWENTDKEVHLYPLEPRTIIENENTFKQLEQGGFEFNIIQKKKPPSPEIVLDFESQGLKFYPQLPLIDKITEEEKAKGWTATETEIKDEKGKMVYLRPENVVGSYAIYHSTRGNMHPSEEEAEKYKISKFGQFYYPYLEDSNDWRVRAESFKIEDGKVRVKMPDDFWNNAVYPIKHSAGLTFGYTEEGSGIRGLDNYIVGSKFTGAIGTATLMSAYLKLYDSGDNDHNAVCGIYEYDDPNYNLITNGGTNTSLTTSTTYSWKTHTFSTNPTISATLYWLCIHGESTTGNLIIAIDDSEELTLTKSLTYTGSAPASFSGVSGIYDVLSIYCTYTPAAAERRVIIIE